MLRPTIVKIALIILSICTLFSKKLEKECTLVTTWCLRMIAADRWTHSPNRLNEIAETVFDVVNQDADKIESKRRHRPRGDEPDEIGMIQ